jgi:hypothetical protein
MEIVLIQIRAQTQQLKLVVRQIVKQNTMPSHEDIFRVFSSVLLTCNGHEMYWCVTIVLAEFCAMLKVHADFGHPLLGIIVLLASSHLTVLLWEGNVREVSSVDITIILFSCVIWIYKHIKYLVIEWWVLLECD